jgi:hypothetical protein
MVGIMGRLIISGYRRCQINRSGSGGRSVKDYQARQHRPRIKRDLMLSYEIAYF